MSERIPDKEIRALSLPDVRSYLEMSGFSYVGPWGKFLDRYQLERDGRAIDAIVPSNPDILDYKERISELIAQLATLERTSTVDIFREISVATHSVVRLRARPGSEITSIDFEEGIGLLQNAKILIKSSAVSAFSNRYKKVIRGKSSSAVDRYMDKVRIGQTEVGSYIFNLILPREDDVLGINQPAYTEHDVTRVLENGILFAHNMKGENRAPSFGTMQDAGISANFLEALHEIIDWSDDVSIEIDRADAGQKRTASFAFNRDDLAIIHKAASKLAPDEQGTKTRVSGTITRLSEPATRRRGSIDLLVRLKGRLRSVRIKFEAADRDTIIRAFKEKDSRMLSVEGILKTERNGHLVLEDPRRFDASKRGSLL